MLVFNCLIDAFSFSPSFPQLLKIQFADIINPLSIVIYFLNFEFTILNNLFINFPNSFQSPLIFRYFYRNTTTAYV